MHRNGVFGFEVLAGAQVVHPRTRSKIALVVHIVAAAIPWLDAHKRTFGVCFHRSPQRKQRSVEVHVDVWLVLLVDNAHAGELVVLKHVGVGSERRGGDGKCVAAVWFELGYLGGSAAFLAGTGEV